MESRPQELEQHYQLARRQLIGTVLLGLMAACLAFVGQSALGQARPLFEQFGLQYGFWQSFYHFVLWALALAWLAALIQQVLHYTDISERHATQQRIAAQQALRAQQAREAAEERDRANAVATASRQRDEERASRRANRKGNSNIFDY